MGSLMAGWGSHARHLHPAERNRSLTKEEIASFWRSKEEEDFLKASCGLSKEDNKVEYDGNEEAITQSLIVKDEKSVEPLLKRHGWWISSEWAFLNEPHKNIAEASNKYVAQFHIAPKHVNNIDLYRDQWHYCLKTTLYL